MLNSIIVAVMQGDRWGLVEITGKTLLSPQLKSMPVFKNGYAKIFVDGEYLLMDQSGRFQTLKEYEALLYHMGAKTYLTDNIIPNFVKRHYKTMVDTYNNELLKQGYFEYITDNVLTQSQKTNLDDVIKTVIQKYDSESLKKWAKENISDKNLVERLNTFDREKNIVPIKVFSDGRNIEERINGSIYTHSVRSEISKLAVFFWHSFHKKEVLRIDSRDHSVTDFMLGLLRIVGGKGTLEYYEGKSYKYTMPNGTVSRCEYTPISAAHLSNGDILLISKVYFSTKVASDIYWTPGITVNVQGHYRNVGGGYFKDDKYSNDKFFFATVFDKDTKQIKYQTELPIEEGWTAMISKYGGFWCVRDIEYRSGYNYDNSKVIGDSKTPMFYFDNKANLLWTYSVKSEDEKIYDFDETPNSICLAGCATNVGYIGYDNPFLRVVSKSDFNDAAQHHKEDKEVRFSSVICSEGIAFLQKESQSRYSNSFIKSAMIDLKEKKTNVNDSNFKLQCEWTEWGDKVIGGCGLVDENGNWIIQPVGVNYFYRRSEGWTIFAFKEGLALVGHKDKCGFVDMKANLVIPLQFENGLSFSEGLAAVQKDGKWGFINAKGNIAIPFMYDKIVFYDGEGTGVEYLGFMDGLAPVSVNGKWGFINKQGETVIPFDYHGASPFVDGVATVMLNENETVEIDKKGNIISSQ